MNVELRPLRESDVARMEEVLSSPEGTGELQWFGHRNLQHIREKVAAGGYLGPDDGGLIVEADGAFAGWVSWNKRFWGPRATSWSWEFGILIISAFRGKGIGTAAQRDLVGYLFAHTPVHRIQAGTDVKNLAEQRVLEKIGFQREGVIRRAQWRMGEWHDQILYSILREEWNTAG
ncbi:GNAT family N-acetyltransferase [Spongiactinospora gelatinilytica]|nr:GNAT family protein [Spongiactinospora gelatinilytica]